MKELRFMLIDDDEATHMYHKIMIGDAGLNMDLVETFVVVDEALGALRASKENNEQEILPDYIILDLNMPVKNGWDFLDEFQEIDFIEKKPKVLLVTNSEHPADLEKAKTYPVILGYYPKFLEASFFENIELSLSSF